MRLVKTRNHATYPNWIILSTLFVICLGMSLNIAIAANLQDGLVNYWPLDGEDGYANCEITV